MAPRQFINSVALGFRNRQDYYGTGIIKSEIPYKDGNKNGIEKKYYESGIIESKIPYKDGKLNGIVKYYYETGIIKTEYSYRDGKQNGKSKHYYRTGIIQSEYAQNGIVIYYDETGKIKSKSTFKSDELSEVSLNVIRFICLFVFLVLPFLIMAIKGRKYAHINASSSKLFLGCIIWFTLSSWAVLGVGGHGLIAAPIPNTLAVPIWFIYSGDRGMFNFPHDVLFKHSYWFLPLLHILIFYTSYILSRSNRNRHA